MKATPFCLRRVKRESGFTLVEMMVVLMIIAVLFALTSVNLAAPQQVASLNSTVDTILADLRSQQLLAMLGSTAGTTQAQPEGVLVHAHDYVLFAGSSYNPADTNNFTVDSIADSATLTTTLPSNTIQFDKGSGDVSSFDPSHNTITVSVSNQQKVLTINKLGVIDVQ